MLSARQKRQARKIISTVVIAAVLTVGSLLLYNSFVYRKAEFTRYPQFGIDIPEQYSIHGIDVSKYQSMIAWNEVKAMKVKNIQLGFAFIKATEGTGSVDPQFKRNWKKSKQAGLFRGAYHFFIASSDGSKQAERFIKTVDLKVGDMPPVLDVEQLNGVSAEQLKAEIKEWLLVVEKHYGVRPIIYTNVDFYNKNLGSEFDKYPLWAAHYRQSGKPRIGRDWHFWQHSDEGRVNGIISRVDFNVFKGDSTEFVNMLIN